MNKRYSFKYKLRSGDNYKNLVQRFGNVVLGDAGIYGDEDLVKDKEYTFGVNTREEAETAQKKDLEYQTQRNQAIARRKNTKQFDSWWTNNGENFLVKYYGNKVSTPEQAERIKQDLRNQYISGGQDINKTIENYKLREDAFWQGQTGLSDEDLQSKKETINQNAIAEEQRRTALVEKRNQQLNNDSQRYYGRNDEGQLIFRGAATPEAQKFNRYHTGRVDYLRANGNKGIIGRGLTLNNNTSLSYQDSMKNLGDQLELGEDLQDYAKKGAGVAVGLAAGTSVLPAIPQKFLTQTITGTLADIGTRKGLDYAKVDKNSYLYKTLPLFTSILAGNLSTSIPEYLTLRSAVKTAPEYAKYLIKNGVSASAQNANSLKGVIAHETLGSVAGSLPAYPISQGLQSLGVNETVADVAGAGIGGLWGAGNAANAHRAYHFTTGSGGQIGLKNVAKNYLANGMKGRQYDALKWYQKGLLGGKQIGKGLLNVAVPVKNWGHGGYSAVYESDLGATVARAGDMVKRAPKGVTGAVDAAYNLGITPTGTHNVGSYMGAQDAKSLSLVQQLHQALEPIYGRRVGGNKMMTMFSNLPEEESAKILKGMTIDVDGVATPLVRDGNIDSEVLQKALRYNADFNGSYIKTSSGNYRSYGNKGDKFFIEHEGQMLPVKKIFGKDYIKTGFLKYKKADVDISNRKNKIFGLNDDGTYARVQNYKQIRNNKNAPVPKTANGIPFTGYGQNTTVGDVYLNINDRGVPTATTLAQDIRGHVDVVGSYNGNNMVISLDPYATGSGGGNSLGAFFGKFLDRNMKHTPVLVNFNTGSSTYGKSAGKKLFMPLSTEPTRVKGNVDKYWQILNHEGFKPGQKTFTIDGKQYTINDSGKMLEFKKLIESLPRYKRGGKLLPNIIGL